MFGGQRGFVGHPLGYKALNVLIFYNITRLIMGKDTTQYKWKVLAWNCMGSFKRHEEMDTFREPVV